MNLQRVATLVRKESREILRDRLFFVLAIVVPAILMLTLGYGLTTDMEDVPIAILDHDRTPLSREYAHKFIGSRYFDFRGYLQREGQIDPLITAERVRVVVVIPSPASKATSARAERSPSSRWSVERSCSRRRPSAATYRPPTSISLPRRRF